MIRQRGSDDGQTSGWREIGRPTTNSNEGVPFSLQRQGGCVRGVTETSKIQLT